MCGIVGILQYESKVPATIRNEAIRILFSEALIKTETRGEDATGVFQVCSNNDWMAIKTGAKSSNWVYDNNNDKDPARYDDFMRSWDELQVSMPALVGHCRKATVGSRGGDNNDNHPFAIQVDATNALLGIHNGTLENHDVIYSKLPEGLVRQGSTDSEAIFHFLYHLTEQGKKPITGEVIRELGRRLEGAYACITVNSKFPNLIGTFRSARPMEYFMISPLNIVLIVSEKKFADAALEQYRFVRAFLGNDLPELQTGDRTLPDREWRLFDTTLPFPDGKPCFADLNKISSAGEIRKFSDAIHKDWTKASASTATQEDAGSRVVNQGSRDRRPTTTPHQNDGVKSKIPVVIPATTHTVRSSKKDEKTLSKPASSEDIVETVGEIIEVELSDVTPKRSLARIKSLGICTHYTSDTELNTSLGLPVGTDVSDLVPTELANRVALLHFTLGYATSNFDHHSERAESRARSKDLLPKLERAEMKKQRAESHIWEHKQLLVFLMSLAAEGFDLDMKNIALSLTAFPEMGTERKKGIMEAARRLFKDDGVRKIVDALREKYRIAEEKEQRQLEEKEQRRGVVDQLLDGADGN